MTSELLGGPRTKSLWAGFIVLAVLASTLLISEVRPARPGGTLVLNWEAPTEREDDQPLENLSGYVIHCWAQAGAFEKTIYINDPAVTSYRLRNLKPGNYLCAMKSFDSEGVQSVLSNIVARTVG